MTRVHSRPDTINPYIALADLTISLVLIVLFFVALGRLGLVNFKYKRAMDGFASIVARLPVAQRPHWERGRNDPPGVQRWVFDGHLLFAPVARDKRNTIPQLTEEGRQSLSGFARLLQQNRAIWRRIRVEGHTLPPPNDGHDDWDLSARRAAVVVRQIEVAGNIPPWFFAVAGRAGQNPLYKVLLFSSVDSREDADIQRKLQRAGIHFSRKDGKSQEAVALRKRFGTDKRTFLDVRTDSDEDHVINTDGQEFAVLAAHFQQNERVEVLIEFTQQGSPYKSAGVQQALR
jgi:hypothetical protein